jgi:hypothetical protein
MRSAGRTLFSIKRVSRQNESQPAEMEKRVFIDLDKIIASCEEAIYA